MNVRNTCQPHRQPEHHPLQHQCLLRYDGVHIMMVIVYTQCRVVAMTSSLITTLYLRSPKLPEKGKTQDPFKNKFSSLLKSHAAAL